jgi:ribokinase
VKMGDKGCYVTNGEEKKTIQPYKVNAVDTTGAGDAFDAGFLYGLVQNRTLEDCGKLGNFVASRSVMKMGARDGLPTREDLVF